MKVQTVRADRSLPVGAFHFLAELAYCALGLVVVIAAPVLVVAHYLKQGVWQ